LTKTLCVSHTLSHLLLTLLVEPHFLTPIVHGPQGVFPLYVVFPVGTTQPHEFCSGTLRLLIFPSAFSSCSRPLFFPLLFAFCALLNVFTFLCFSCSLCFFPFSPMPLSPWLVLDCPTVICSHSLGLIARPTVEVFFEFTCFAHLLFQEDPTSSIYSNRTPFVFFCSQGTLGLLPGILSPRFVILSKH